jgi:glycerol kinase
VIALALDLGSTRLKAAALDARGELGAVHALDAPPVQGSGERREFDPLELAARAEALLREAQRGLPRGLPLGIASQRSSFLLWQCASGAPATPVVSWQDRRAADWCARHRHLEPLVRERTGLVLSPHYAGPKLAAMIERDGELARELRSGKLLFGTLETWLAWRWSRVHASDLSMAARTLLADVEASEWSRALGAAFGATPSALPALEPTAGRGVELDTGPRLAATVADQSAGALAAIGRAPASALVNFGTGVFVLAPCARLAGAPEGILTSVLERSDRAAAFAREGTINAGGAWLGRIDATPGAPSERDEHPDGFCMPDEAGWGAPHWRAERTALFSPAASGLPPRERRAIALEGLVFRVAALLETFGRETAIERVALSGGAARDPAFAPYLAAVLERPVDVLEDGETTLLGAARLAAGLELPAPLASQRFEPNACFSWLATKAPRWSAWLAAELRK